MPSSDHVWKFAFKSYTENHQKIRNVFRCSLCNEFKDEYEDVEPL